MPCLRLVFVLLLLFALATLVAGQSVSLASPQKIIIDTDIGDDIDDAFAVVLALRSPELQILGISTAFGDTQVRAQLLDRLLGEAGRRSEEHTSELQSLTNLVCRLLLEKKKR